MNGGDIGLGRIEFQPKTAVYRVSGLHAFIWGTPHTRLRSGRQISCSGFQGPESPDSMDHNWRKARNRIDLPLCFQCWVSVWHVPRHLIRVCWTEWLVLLWLGTRWGSICRKRMGKAQNRCLLPPFCTKWWFAQGLTFLFVQCCLWWTNRIRVSHSHNTLQQGPIVMRVRWLWAKPHSPPLFCALLEGWRKSGNVIVLS